MGARWRGYSHPELYEMINAGPGPNASAEQTAYWNSLTASLEQIDADLNKALNELKVNWRGSAADSTSAGLNPLQQWAADAQTGSTIMRISSEDQAEYISTARAEMPKPVQVTTPEPATWQVVGATGLSVLGISGPADAVARQAADHEAQEAAQAAAEQKAVDTMVTYESSSTWNRNTLGTFVPPPDVVVEVAGGEGTQTPTGQIGSGLGSTYTLPPNDASQTDAIRTPPNVGGGGDRPPAPVLVPPGPGADVNPSGSAFLPPTRTDPSFVTPPPVAPAPTPPLPGPTPLPPGTPPGGPPGFGPLGPGGGPYAPGGTLPVPGSGQFPGGSNPPGTGPGGGKSSLPGVRGGVPGAGGPGGGASGFGPGGIDADGRAGSQQLGRGGGTGLGMAGEGVVSRGGGAGTAGTGARGGGVGAGPMGAGGRAGGDEDEEHFSPDYLLETTDVFGDERMVSPAVIGENPNSDDEKK